MVTSECVIIFVIIWHLDLVLPYSKKGELYGNECIDQIELRDQLAWHGRMILQNDISELHPRIRGSSLDVSDDSIAIWRVRE